MAPSQTLWQSDSNHVIEKNAHCGGWLHTDHYRNNNGDFLFERGPHSCRAHSGGESVLELIEMLELSEELLHAHKQANKRYLYVNKQLMALPHSPLQCLLSLFSPLTRSSLPGLLTEWTVPSRYSRSFNPQENPEEETVHTWATRRLGKTIAERLMDPFMRGIFAGNSRLLSMEACLPTLVKQEQTHGSLTRALLASLFQKTPPTTDSPSYSPCYSPWVRTMLPRGLFTLRQGWSALTQRLVEHLSKIATVRTGLKLMSMRPTPCPLPHPRPRQTIELLLQGGERLEADAVYLTTPAHVSAHILRAKRSPCSHTITRHPFR